MMAARDALIKHLTAYQDQSGVRVVLVFDGKGAKIAEETEPGGIQVFYAPADRTADSIIERLVAKYSAAHRLTVASSDGLVQQTSLTFGAELCLTAEQLRTTLDAAGRIFEREIKGHRRR